MGKPFTTTCRFISHSFVIAATMWGSSARPIPETTLTTFRRLYGSHSRCMCDLARGLR